MWTNRQERGRGRAVDTKADRKREINSSTILYYTILYYCPVLSCTALLFLLSSLPRYLVTSSLGLVMGDLERKMRGKGCLLGKGPQRHLIPWFSMCLGRDIGIERERERELPRLPRQTERGESRE